MAFHRLASNEQSASTPNLDAGATGEFIALLGRRDEPTDALQDYCRYLGAAFARRRIHLKPVDLPWDREGWRKLLRWLRSESLNWRGNWVLVQYTALSWSSRGFPIGFFAVLRILRRNGARVALVFHDANPFDGARLVDRCRRWLQRRIMLAAYRIAEKSFFAIQPERIAWLPADASKAHFIPIGANVPVPDELPFSPVFRPSSRKTIAVFSVTDGAGLERQVSEISDVVSKVARKVPDVHLDVFGRGSKRAQQALETAFRDKPVILSVLGILPDEEVTSHLSNADVMLFTRGGVAGTRGTVLAAIACGVPVVGYEGPETGFPVIEAGISLAPWSDRDALASALIRLLMDDCLNRQLRERNRTAQSAYFSWDKIAGQFISEFRSNGANS